MEIAGVHPAHNVVDESYLDAPVNANDCIAESFQSVWD